MATVVVMTVVVVSAETKNNNVKPICRLNSYVTTKEN